ncbi:MAG: hypothetical protein ACR2LK_00020 [Solirubrobacteraceae bacterium]
MLVSVLIAAGFAAMPGNAAAKSKKVNVAVGIGDQSFRMFADPNYRALHLKKARYFIKWDSILKPEELQKADAFVKFARASGVRVLMHISTDNLGAKEGALPSVSQYKLAAKALVDRYRPMGVREWGVWNEVNHKTQPTYRSPKRAAQYYKTFRRLCEGCRIVALDVLDQRGVESYIRRWFRAAGSAGRRARVIGIHNYSEVNRRLGEKRSRQSLRQYPGTARIIKAVRRKNRRAKFWYTETGGIVNFGSGALRCNATRAANRTRFMFRLLRRYDRDIERLYSYNWYSADCDGFDAGLVEANGEPRPAYRVFKRELRRARR